MSQAPTLPRFMSGICLDKYGDPTVLQYRTNLSIPELKSESDVLVQVYYASVNPADWKIRKGNLALFYKPTFPFVPGQDASGVVIQSKSLKFKEGDQVMGLNPRSGTYSSYALYRDSELAKKPDQISHAEASGLPTVALATKQAFDWANLERGQRVLILGGAGGVGSYAIQYAKHVLGAEVYATCSNHNTDYVRKLGADHVVNHNVDK
jgi:NADPH:quinone reductase-like Zn-dependent oxidoreductase